MATDNDLKLAFFILEDACKVIAAGKSQRWDVLKWGVAINLALPTAMIATKADRSERCWYFSFAVMVALIGVSLIVHYTTRMNGARNNGAKAFQFLQDSGLELPKMTAEDYTKTVTASYDTQELIVFPVILLISCIPSLIIALS